MPNDFDVAVVGAGPAGAWAAYRLAGGGARVAVIDGSHPREKPCGGGVSARALALLRPVAGRLPAATDAADARFTACGRTASVPLRELGATTPALIIAARRDLDGALLDAALAGGAHHVPRRVVSIARASAGWTLVTDTNRLTASWLIGADGANSLVRRRVRRAFTRKDLSVAAGYYVRGQRAGAVDIEFTGLPPGYLWSFPRPDHLAVGICGQADGTSSTELFDAARRWVASHIGAADSALTRYSWPIPSLSEDSIAHEEPSGDGWLLAGDAAGLVDPITREGIFFALQSAEFASQSMMGRNPSATYSRLVRAHIHPELRRAARMKSRFFAPAFSALLMSALARSGGIRAVMADLVSGRQTYRGLRRRLLMTGELRLALAYLRL